MLLTSPLASEHLAFPPSTLLQVGGGGEMGEMGNPASLMAEDRYLPPPSGDQKQGSPSSTSRPPQSAAKTICDKLTRRGI